MPPNPQQNVVQPLHASLSPERIGTYLTAANFDQDRALALYIWNASVGEAFHLPMQSVEVAIRNRINVALKSQYGPEWWRDHKYMRDAGGRLNKDIATATRRVQNKHHPLTTGRIVANLSFGFWTTMLGSSWNPKLWSFQLRNSFPDLPQSIDRDELHKRARAVNSLRNRIWHHEPIFKDDLLKRHSETLELLRWVCPAKHKWIRPHCRLPALMRTKP